MIEKKDEVIENLKTNLSRFSRENSDQQKQLDELKTILDQLQSSISAQMNDGFAKLQTSNSKPETILGQNIPNPFDNSHSLLSASQKITRMLRS